MREARHKKLLRFLKAYPQDVAGILPLMEKVTGKKYTIKMCLDDLAQAREEGWLVYERFESTNQRNRRYWFWLDAFQAQQGEQVEERIARLDSVDDQPRDWADGSSGFGERAGVECSEVGDGGFGGAAAEV